MPNTNARMPVPVSEKPVTERQMEIARFFVETFREKGYWPSLREAADHFDVYIKAITNHLELLEQKKRIAADGTESAIIRGRGELWQLI
jgi:hypothetical protein